MNNKSGREPIRMYTPQNHSATFRERFRLLQQYDAVDSPHSRFIFSNPGRLVHGLGPPTPTSPDGHAFWVECL